MRYRDQAGFAHILITLAVVVLAVSGLVVYRVSNDQSDKDTNAQKTTCSISGSSIEVPRVSAKGAFTYAITDINTITSISSGKQVGDSRVTYLWIKDKQRIPVYAPADGTLIKIEYKNRADLPPSMSLPDYDVTFLVDCQMMYSINHITDPIPELSELKVGSEPQQVITGQPAPSEMSKPKANLKVKAGQQLGTTVGTPSAHNWDFGVFIDNEAACPYEQFDEPIRSAWLALMGDNEKPIAGTKCEVSGKP
ncbi:MAG: hypothetical protein Q7R60_04180 [bacterium]|nr:hypothetical protein [bacterium]